MKFRLSESGLGNKKNKIWDNEISPEVKIILGISYPLMVYRTIEESFEKLKQDMNELYY